MNSTLQQLFNILGYTHVLLIEVYRPTINYRPKYIGLTQRSEAADYSCRFMR